MFEVLKLLHFDAVVLVGGILGYFVNQVVDQNLQGHDQVVSVLLFTEGTYQPRFLAPDADQVQHLAFVLGLQTRQVSYFLVPLHCFEDIIIIGYDQKQ